MRFFKLLLVGLMACVSNLALATTYTFTGPVYDLVGGTYTTAMSVKGSFTTASPLPPNLAGDPIGPGAGTQLVTSWSFSDGRQTFTNANSVVLDAGPGGSGGQAFAVQTDETGNVVGAFIILVSPQMPVAPGEPFNLIGILGPQSIGAIALNLDNGALENFGSAQTPGVWTMSETVVSVPVAVPAVSPAALLFLAMALAALGYRQQRRKA